MKWLERRKDAVSVTSENIKITKVRSPQEKKTHGWCKRRMRKKEITHAELMELTRLRNECMRRFWMVSVRKKDVCVWTKQRLRNKKNRTTEKWKLYATFPTGPSVYVMYGCEQNKACGIKKTNVHKRKTYMLVLLRDRWKNEWKHRNSTTHVHRTQRKPVQWRCKRLFSIINVDKNKRKRPQNDISVSKACENIQKNMKTRGH